jgi:nucleotide-binding universal stress UspA family protein
MGDVADLGNALFGRPIVVGLDESDTAQRALSAAIDLARTLSCPLVVVSAYRRMHDSKLRGARRDAPADVEWRLQGDSHVQTLLDEARERADTAGVAFEAVAREGTPANVIVEVAAEKDAGLVIVGNRGMRGGGRLKGSVPNDVSHSAPCSVLIVDTVGAVAA